MISSLGVRPFYGAANGKTTVGTDAAEQINGGNGDDHLDGAGGDDTVVGGDGHDTLLGGAGDDLLIPERRTKAGLPGGNVLFGEGGNDHIYMGVGDTADGGSAHDTFTLLLSDQSALDIDLTGLDRHGTAQFGDTSLTSFEGGYLLGSAFGDHISIGRTVIAVDCGLGDDMVDAAGASTVRGGQGDDHLTGNGYTQWLQGDGGNDVLIGGGGQDSITGNNGDDTISGGGQIDAGAGDDLIILKSASSVVASTGADVIRIVKDGALDTDFQLVVEAEDLMDLSKVDADLTTAGDQAFVLVEAFTGHAGEMMFTDGGPVEETYLNFDRDGDGVADAVMTFSGMTDATFSNFVL